MSEALYQQALKALAEAAHGAGRLDDADARVRLDNPLCGDRITVHLRMAGGRVAAVAHETRGCLLCRAAASAIGRRAPGLTPAEIAAAAASAEAQMAAESPPAPAWPELEAFRPVRGHPSRRGCVSLPFQALRQALGDAGRRT
ncbi:MAG: iron-sulfur cluster assembly scaffold protein [Rhodocyclaceae bacterium]|nr:iron-sulfur cluster assembly scaffold protein [Rhodocyclaceae bacterium]